LLKNYAKKSTKNDAKNDAQKVGYKLTKNDAKIHPQNLIYILKLYYIMAGSKIIKNDQFSVRGVRGGHFINFLKFRTFLQKRSIF
jgi:hypothetical protein